MQAISVGLTQKHLHGYTFLQILPPSSEVNLPQTHVLILHCLLATENCFILRAVGLLAHLAPGAHKFLTPPLHSPWGSRGLLKAPERLKRRVCLRSFFQLLKTGSAFMRPLPRGLLTPIESKAARAMFTHPTLAMPLCQTML